MSKPRFFTGIQATGTLTLGNYCGAIKPILDLQKKGTHEIIIMIGDLHALTIPNREINYREKCYEIAALLYACGLKEENCKIFIQSEIKEHLELAFFLSPHIMVGRLGDMTQYKDKKGKETGNLALLSYPVLMAADIFLYTEQEEKDLVIVGQDQQQHLELANRLANKFNSFYGKNLLKVPQFTIPSSGGKIRGLKDPTKKMSKSENDYIGLLDTPPIVKEKFKKAETDSEGKIYYDPEKKKGISNLLTIYALLKDKEISEVEKETKELNYSDFKEKVAEIVNEKLALIQKNYNIYRPKIREIIKKNNEYLKSLAEKKITEIKKEIKFNY